MKNGAIINPHTSKEIIESLKRIDLEPILIPLCSSIEKPIAGHPDIQLFHHNNKLFCHPGLEMSFLKQVERYCEVIICKTKLNKKYPHDIAYNIAATNNFAFHKVSNTEPAIKNYFIKNKVTLIDVKQGYTKCSTLMAGQNRIITADRSIHSEAEKSGLQSLLIDPGEIDLPGYSYGFIGGASSNIPYQKKILLTGQIYHHTDYNRIIEYLEKYDMDLFYLSENRIIDLGTIFII